METKGTYRVVLLNPSEWTDAPEVAYEGTREHALVWVEAWERREWVGLVAVLWPPAAPLPVIPS